MFEKNLRLSYLLDFYGETLDEHTRAVMKAYYDDDLSLAEIADGIGISRQGVRHLIKKGEEQLSFLEERLGLIAQSDRLALFAEELLRIRDALLSYSDKDIRALVPSIEEIAQNLAERK